MIFGAFRLFYLLWKISLFAYKLAPRPAVILTKRPWVRRVENLCFILYRVVSPSWLKWRVASCIRNEWRQDHRGNKRFPPDQPWEVSVSCVAWWCAGRESAPIGPSRKRRLIQCGALKWSIQNNECFLVWIALIMLQWCHRGHLKLITVITLSQSGGLSGAGVGVYRAARSGWKDIIFWGNWDSGGQSSTRARKQKVTTCRPLLNRFQPFLFSNLFLSFNSPNFAEVRY